MDRGVLNDDTVSCRSTHRCLGLSADIVEMGYPRKATVTLRFVSKLLKF